MPRVVKLYLNWASSNYTRKGNKIQCVQFTKDLQWIAYQDPPELLVDSSPKDPSFAALVASKS